MTSVQVLALDGCLPSSLAITLDVLSTANRIAERSGRPRVFEVTTVDGSRPLDDRPAGADLVVVPGLGTAGEDEVVARLHRPDARAAGDVLRAARDAGAALASSCTGVFLLADHGLLKGRRATTSWWLAPLFARRYPDVDLRPDALVVTDDFVTTAGAAMAQLDLMLALVARHADDGLADRCAAYLLVDRRTSQARYVRLEDVSALDRDLGRARRWAVAHLADPITVGDVARAVHVSPRTFARRVRESTGLSPSRFLRRLRVEQAVELLRTTDRPVDAVARAVGYSDPTALRRAMRHERGEGPRAVRERRSPG